MADRTNFIEPTETLLRQCKSNDGHLYFAETDDFGDTYRSPVDAFFGDDDFARAYRLDRETMTMEDVTEDCAEAFLERFDSEPGAVKIPEFVEGSEAYEGYCERYYTRNGIGNVDYTFKVRRDRQYNALEASR